ncbi:MAG: Cna B-type domain-containing protein [Coriobacteriia bacterium]|nr:Cna B-type domain-containing protein [Coriobacteriia bacterium]
MKSTISKEGSWRVTWSGNGAGARLAGRSGAQFASQPSMQLASWSHPHRSVRLLAGFYALLAITLAVSLCLPSPRVAYAESFSDVFTKVADPNTSNHVNYFGSTTLDNGRIWTDKSVNTDAATIYDSGGNAAVTITASSPESFLVTLSALSQSYTVDILAEPVDVVFIIDISGSMTESLGDSTRVEVMITALNFAIKTLMEAHPDNRVAIVGYGAIPSYKATPQPKIVDILPLDHYAIPSNGEFLFVGANGTDTTIEVNSALGVSTPATAVEGGTPTQRGIHRGARVLLDNPDTTYDFEISPGYTVTVPRKPVMVLLTDGEPTMGWQDYQFLSTDSSDDTLYDTGNRINGDMGHDLLAVATITYFKQLVTEHYYGTNYGENFAWVYTIGVGEPSIDQEAVLDPMTFAGSVSYTHSGVTYNMKNLLENLVDPSTHHTGAFPVLSRVEPPSTARVLLPGLSNWNAADSKMIFDSFDYTDGYYPAEDPEKLMEAFEAIASDIVTQKAYSTQTDPEDPDFTGHMMFSDTLGQYVEFKNPLGFWINNQLYDGADFAAEMEGGAAGSGSYWYWFAEEMGAWRKLSGTTTEIGFAGAESLILSSQAGGSLYYNNADDYSAVIKWYGGFDAEWLENYYDTTTGEVNEAPANAACIVEHYSVKGIVHNSVTGKDTDIGLASILVITALQEGLFSLENEGATVDVYLLEGQQNVRWYIPASLIPMRTVQEQQTFGRAVLSVDIVEASPIRCVYEVGLLDNIEDALAVSEQYKADFSDGNDGWYYYTNDGGHPASDSLNRTTVIFNPSLLNRYYIFTDDTPLFSDSDGTAATSYSADTTYYVLQQYYDANYPGFERSSYEPVTLTADDVEVISGQLHIKAGTQNTSADTWVAKTSNTTQTSDAVFAPGSSGAGIQSPGSIVVQTLGNNGRLNAPGTRVTVTKQWEGQAQSSVWVQLYANDDVIGVPVRLDAGNSWSYTFTGLACFMKSSTMVPDGYSRIVYTVKEGTVALVSGNLVFTPYGPGNVNADYDISYTQPVWDSETNRWQDAVVTNTRHPSPPDPPDPPGPPVPPKKPPGSNTPNTGDGSVWLLVLSGALLAGGLTVVTGSRRKSLLQR